MRPTMLRPSFARSPWICAVVAAVGLSASCRKGEPEAGPPGEVGPVASEDATGLPAFDMSDDSPTGDGVPFERFFVELGDAPVRGSSSAPVTIVAFSDFECPYCEKGHTIIQQVEREYGEKVRIAYKAYPLDFHSHAMIAALAARSAQEQGKFWQFHDLLFSQRGLDMPQLDAYARQAGLDIDRLHADIEALTWGPSVSRDMRQARRLGVTGTPAYFVNGRFLSGAKPIEVMRSIIDQEIELAGQWQAQGVAPGKLYEHAIAKGYREVQYAKPRKGLRPDVIYPVPVADSPQRGPATAPVTVVEFADFECGFCARGNETVEKLRKRYGDKLRVVYKHFPLSFHGNAFMAARGALAAAAEGKFWEFHDRLYATKAKFDEASLLEIAKAVGLNPKKFKQRLHSDEFDAKIVADQELGHTLGIRGTPAYFVNGRALDGAVPELEFRLTIQEELERAEDLLREGVPAAGLYERLLSPKRPDTSG